MSLVLSLFPGIGLLDMAFELEDFTVVRGPDVLWGGDIRRFHPPAGKFDGIIGGPPCQSFSSLAHLVRANGHEPKFGNLIPEFERCVTEAGPEWFLMEEVPAAPIPVVPGYGVKPLYLDNAWILGEDGFGQEQMRKRVFSFGLRGKEPVNLARWIDFAVLMLPKAEPTLTQWTPDNSPEVKRRVRTVTKLGPDHLTGLAESTKRMRTGAKGPPPSVRDKQRKPAVTSSDGGKSVRMDRARLPEACRLQGLPENFLEHAPFTAEGKLKAVANGVPLPMGRAIARAVKECLQSAP